MAARGDVEPRLQHMKLKSDLPGGPAQRPAIKPLNAQCRSRHGAQRHAKRQLRKRRVQKRLASSVDAHLRSRDLEKIQPFVRDWNVSNTHIHFAVDEGSL